MIKVIDSKAYVLVDSRKALDCCLACVAGSDKELCNKLGLGCGTSPTAYWKESLEHSIEIEVNGRVYAPQTSAADVGCTLCAATVALEARTVCTRLVKHQILVQKLADPYKIWHYTCALTTD
jgi:hypothetical protein